MFVLRFIAIAFAIARGDELRSFAAKVPAAQNDIKFYNLGEEKLWQSKSYMERIRGRRSSAA